MTPLDAAVAIAVLLLVWAVIRAWRGPIPKALMRPSHLLRVGIDPFVITSQSTDGQWCRIEATDALFLSDWVAGDVIFIEQLNGPTQMFYINHAMHNHHNSVLYLVRDPE